jgi:hypothetical protein
MRAVMAPGCRAMPEQADPQPPCLLAANRLPTRCRRLGYDSS